jgi:hypothetical protein
MSERCRSTSIGNTAMIHKVTDCFFNSLAFYKSDVEKCKCMHTYILFWLCGFPLQHNGIERILDFINLFSQKSLNNAMQMLNATIMLNVQYACIMPTNVHLGHRVSTCALYMYSLLSSSICYAYSNYVAREYWMVYRRPGLKAVVWFGSSPIPPLLPSASCLSFWVFLCLSPSSLLTGEVGGGAGAKSYDGEKAWSSLNHSIQYSLYVALQLHVHIARLLTHRNTVMIKNKK